MDTLPSIIPSKRRVFRARRRDASSTVVGPPTLVGATYDQSLSTLTLAFDRAADLAGFAPGQVSVIDGPNAQLFQASSATLIAPAIVLVDLFQVDSASGDAVLLDATPANGIVAADNAEAWGGATNLELPFP
jgi:hypothetical protein